MVRMVIMSVELEPKGGRLRESECESERERKERSESERWEREASRDLRLLKGRITCLVSAWLLR